MDATFGTKCTTALSYGGSNHTAASLWIDQGELPPFRKHLVDGIVCILTSSVLQISDAVQEGKELPARMPPFLCTSEDSGIHH